MTSGSTPKLPPRPKRPGLWGLLQLHLAIHRMEKLNEAGADLEIIRTADRYRQRWKGNARFYSRLAGAHWGANHWHEAVRFGRMALALDAGHVQTVVFVLAAYRSGKCEQGLVFGESWLQRQGLKADVCRHLSFLYDDLDRPAEALAWVRRGVEKFPSDRRLAACMANYLAKTEGAASALEFARARNLLSGDPYAPDTVANGLSSIRAYPEAEKIFSDLHRRYPGNAKYMVSLLDALYHQDRYRDTVTAGERWEKMNQMTGPIANEVGRAYLELGRYDEALAWIKRAVELSPDSAKFADNHAISLGRAGRYAEGVEASQRRLESTNLPDRQRLLSSIGSDLSNLGRHVEAMRYYQQAFAEFPDTGDTLVDVIVGYNWLEQYDDAVAFGLRYRESRGPGLPPRYWSELGWAFHKGDRFQEEAGVVREWRRLHPHDANVARVMKRALNSLERRDEALTFVRAWVEAHPTDAQGWRYLAEQQEECGRPAEQLAALKEGSRLAPGDAGFISEIISTLRRLKRSKEALELGVAWDSARPGQAPAELLNRVGLAADDLEDWPAAERYYRRAHDGEPHDGTWIGNLLRAFICANRATEAVELGRAWLAAHPWNSYLAGKLAWAMREAGRLADETEVLRQAVAASPQDEEWHHLLLANLTARKLTDEAAAWVEHCRSIGVASSRNFNDWANYLRDLDRFDASESAYREALVKGPDNGTAAGNLVSLQVLAGRLEEAIKFGEQWLERRPDDHYVRRQLADAYYTGNDYTRAEAGFRRVREHEPDSSFVAGRIVACLRLTDKFEEAIGEATSFLKTGSGTGFLYVELGISCHRLGRRDEALRHYEAALQLDPASGGAASRKMRLLGEQQRLVEAMDYGRQWSAAHPDRADADFHNELGILLDRGKQTADAETHFVRAVELDPQNATLAGNAVEILARRGQLAESIQIGQRALAAAPPNAYLLRRLAEAYGQHHEHGAALDLLTSAELLEPADIDIALEFLRLAQDGDELERGLAFGRTWLARPDNAGKAAVWARLARVCFRADEDDEAFTAVERTIELEPNEIAYCRLRFGFWNALDDSHRLTKEFEAVRPDWRDDAVLLRHASRAYRELGMSDEALQLAVRNTQVNPADDDACAWLAELHEHGGRMDLAHECVRSWIDLHGEQSPVLKMRARLAWQEKEFASALADAEKILSQEDSDEDMFVLSIRALRALERREEARTRLNHWLEHHSSSRRVTRLLDDESSDG